MSQPTIRAFFDEPTFTVTYLVSDPATKKAAIIDPVLDYDPAGGVANSRSIDAILAVARAEGLSGRMGSGNPCPRRPSLRRAGREGRDRRQDRQSANISPRCRTFSGRSSRRRISRPRAATSIVCSRMASDSPSASSTCEVLYTPGHTPACVSYKIGDAVFVGDTLFMPDYGAARADFPGGDARALYRSIRRLLDLPPQTRLFMCHDYKAPGRDVYLWETTVAEERAKNVQIRRRRRRGGIRRAARDARQGAGRRRACCCRRYR